MRTYRSEYMVVVKATVTVPGAFPHGPGDPPASVGYNVQSAWVWFDPAKPTPIVVELHDPGAGDHRYIKKLAGQTGPRSFSWSGELYIYDANDNITSGPFYCTASTVFAKIHVSVRDLYWWCFGYYGPTELAKTLTFKSPGLAIRWHSYGYLGQKQTYEAVVQDQVSGAIQWSSFTGNPATWPGQFFGTRFFSAGPKTITAAATVRAEIDWTPCQATWFTQIADIFCLTDSGPNEYNGVFPGNPPLGVYASALISGNWWKTDYLLLNGDGNPLKGKFNPGWLNLYSTHLDHKANNLRNCMWEGPANDPLPAFPWTDGDNGNLLEFSWKGYKPPTPDGTITISQYPQHYNNVKWTTPNCHGESIHGYIGRFGAAGPAAGPLDVEIEIEKAGGSCEPLEGVYVSTAYFDTGDIIFFGANATIAGASHSARVVMAGDLWFVTIWACNAGVVSYGTAAGFDEVTLYDYIDAHGDDWVAVLKVQ